MHFILAIISVLIVLLQKTCLQQYTNRPNGLCLQATAELPPSMRPIDSPNVTMVGTIKDGYEWIEWPENSGINWYRQDGDYGPWIKFK